MNTKLLSKISIVSIITASILFTGCDSKSSEAQVIEQKQVVTKEVKVTTPEIKKKKNLK